MSTAKPILDRQDPIFDDRFAPADADAAAGRYPTPRQILRSLGLTLLALAYMVGIILLLSSVLGR